MLPVGRSVFESLPLLVAEPRVEQQPVQRLPHQPLPGGRWPLPCPQCRGQFLGLANITGGVLKVEKLFVERN